MCPVHTSFLASNALRGLSHALNCFSFASPCPSLHYVSRIHPPVLPCLSAPRNDLTKIYSFQVLHLAAPLNRLVKLNPQT